MKDKINASVITVALIEWLNKKYDEKTITTEMSVNTSVGTKVADVVVSNGHTIAYEIKSELDTTQRLPSQIKGFSEIFEYVYIVYWKNKFSLENLNLAETTGAIEVFIKNDKLNFKIIKKAKINRFMNQLSVAKLLWKSELEYFFNKKNIIIKKSFDKQTLVNLFIQNFNKQEAVKIFRFIVRKRFEKGYLIYQSLQQSVDALQSFVKYKTDKDYLLKL